MPQATRHQTRTRDWRTLRRALDVIFDAAFIGVALLALWTLLALLNDYINH